MELLVPIVVAIITGPVVVILNRLRKENSAQHEENGILLRHIGRKVDSLGHDVKEMGYELKEHLGWHKGREE